jgi:hypothetical protein
MLESGLTPKQSFNSQLVQKIFSSSPRGPDLLIRVCEVGEGGGGHAIFL